MEDMNLGIHSFLSNIAYRCGHAVSVLWNQFVEDDIIRFKYNGKRIMTIMTGFALLGQENLILAYVFRNVESSQQVRYGHSFPAGQLQIGDVDISVSAGDFHIALAVGNNLATRR